MNYTEAMNLIDEHTDYGGSLDKHALAVAISTDAPRDSAVVLDDERAAFRTAVAEMVRMLEEGEWAEHVSTCKAPGDDLAMRLEVAITDLNNHYASQIAMASERAASPQAKNEANQISWNGFYLTGSKASVDEVHRLIRCAGRLAELEASPQATAQTRALTDAVDATIKTIERQLDLISERAQGNCLDKMPIVRSLRAHKQRLEKALLAAQASGGDHDR